MLSNYNPHSRYRERSMQRVSNSIAMVIVIIMSTGVGLWFGKQYAAQNQISLNEQVKTLTTQNTELQESVTELRAEAQTANTRYEQIRAEYESQIPEGPMQDIIKLVREQLGQGMAPERLSFLIRSARPPTGCNEPETKRFVVTTPAYKGPESTVSVADDLVLVSGTGASAKNDKGQPEAWYDPAQAISVRFKNGEVVETKKGNLPLRHSIIANNREYRFTIEEGSRSFAKVVYDSCAYP
jgi:cell division protein FtsB